MALDIGYSKLTQYQKGIFEDCLILGKGGLSIPMGQGKTLTSLVVALKQTTNKILVVVKKSLIHSWIAEIVKFFEGKLKFIVYHSEFIKNLDNYKIPEDVQVVLTTPEVLSKAYKISGIERYLITKEIKNEGMFNQHEIAHYIFPVKNPFLNTNIGLSFFYANIWGVLIIDEAQEYTNISVDKCKSLISICSNYVWLLSGTLFKEPVAERMLGYFMLIKNLDFPDNLPDARKFLTKDFKGFNSSIIKREEKPMDIKVNEFIVKVDLRPEEIVVYKFMKEIVLSIHKKIKDIKSRGNTEDLRKFTAGLLSMITYLRQCLFNPIIPISSFFVDLANSENKKDYTETLINKLYETKIIEYLEDKKNLKSSRMVKIIEDVEKHKKIIIFTSYRTSLDLLKYCLEKEKKYVLTISGDMQIKKRDKILKKFENSEEVILLLTYKIGAEGLNLQSADTVMLVDPEWSFDTMKQAISRILRKGQEHKEIFVYYYISNTAIEEAIFKKQKDKKKGIKELSVGVLKSKVSRMQIKDIIRILEDNRNEKLLSELKI
uniref:Helicase n=1 Tax=viral metagenome TaxID=1070528 RepID=A0A6C0ADV5_9ZZZZ